MNYVACACIIMAIDLRDQYSEQKTRRVKLKAALAERNISFQVRQQVIAHIDQYWEAEGDTDEWHRIMDSLSRRLRTAVLEETHSHLLASPLFKDLSVTSGGQKAVIILLVEKMQTMVALPNEVMVSTGTMPTGLFIIEEGECIRYDPLDQQDSEVLSKGDFFGEGLLSGTRATHRVQTTTPVKLQVLLAPDFEDFLTEYPYLRPTILRSHQKAHELRRTGTSAAELFGVRKANPLAEMLSLVQRFAGTQPKDQSRDTSFTQLPERYLETGKYDILVLKAEWIVQSAREARGQHLARRQDLPREAFYTGKVENRAIIVVSYCWLTPKDPDPEGWHLKLLARLLQLFIAANGDAAVFIDYCCLYQAPRTKEQEKAFDASLRGTQNLYAHQETWTWCMKLLPSGSEELNKYEERGWTTFEMGPQRASNPLTGGDLTLACAMLLRSNFFMDHEPDEAAGLLAAGGGRQ